MILFQMKGQVLKVCKTESCVSIEFKTRRFLALAVLMAGFVGETHSFAQLPGTPQVKQYAWSDSSRSADERADLVIKEMTLEEKLSLLHGQGMPFSATGPTESNGGAGYTNSIPRLGIPAIQMADSAYGVTRGAAAGRYSTALPNNLAAASAWDPQAAFEYGALIGRELRNQGYSMSLGGGVNLTREPRNGRTFEYQGEDPLLAGVLGGSFVKGVQSQFVIGDLKHYAVNDQESGRNAVNANIDRRSMRETDLRAFEIALGIAEPGGVMCSYNRVNGDYACENDYLLNEVLKKELRFKGFVLSDWGGTHSAAKAFHAGLDQEQPGQTFFGEELKKAVQSREVSQDELNEHVRRVLRTIFASGLFDHPVIRQVPDVDRGYALAQSLAERSIVLLKNDGGALPIQQGVRSIVIVGGHADLGVPSGGGSAQVDAPGGSAVPPPPAANSQLPRFVRQQWLPSSPLRALSAALPGVKVTFNSGDDLSSVSTAAREADVAIVFAWQWESEGFDLPSLGLSSDQNALIEAIAQANRRTIVILETGSPVTMPWIDKVAGVVEIWYPGIRGAEALANILTGKVNPTGKLAITFPKSDDDLPHPKLVLPPPESQMNFGAPPTGDITNLMARRARGLPAFQVYYDEGLNVGYKWYDAKNKPVLFPFGFGLSYTTYAYSDLVVSYGESLAVSFKVKNTGERAGSEIAEVYTGFPDAAGEPPKRLIGWSRVDLAPGEEKQVTISADKSRITVYDESTDTWKLVAGTYEIHVGRSSRDLPLQQEVRIQ